MTAAKAKSNETAGRRSGRPTREQSGRLTGQIVDVATRLFCETSFEATSVDLIVATARISKQTFYARFASKEALFAAVIRNGVDELLTPIVTGRDASGPLEARLVRIGVQLLTRALAPPGLLLHRLVSAEAQRFPQLAIAYYENAFVRTRDLIADVFSDALRDKQLRSADAIFMAEQFLHAVIDGPARTVMLSGRLPQSETDVRDQVIRAVRLFLRGASGV